MPRERDESLRDTLFNQLKPLSVSRHPELVKLFCDELVAEAAAFEDRSVAA